MDHIILDAGFKGNAGPIYAIFLLIPLGIMLIEAIVMLAFKLNTFGKCFLDSFIVNLATIVLGIIIGQFWSQINTGEKDTLGIIVALLLSILVEGLLLRLLNKSKPAKKVWLVNVVMNLVSYALLLMLAYA